MPPKSRQSTSSQQERYCQYRLAALLQETRDAHGSAAVVRCVQKSLTKDELATLQTKPDNSLEKFAAAVSSQSAGKPEMEELVVSAAASSVGGWKKAKRFLTVPGRKKWRRVTTNAVKQAQGRKSKVNSQSIADKVRVYLLENSEVTAKLMKVKETVLPVAETHFFLTWASSFPQ